MISKETVKPRLKANTFVTDKARFSTLMFLFHMAGRHLYKRKNCT